MLFRPMATAHGVHHSATVAQSLQQIVERARKADALAAEIATASHEQNQGIAPVNTAVSQMDLVTQGNASGDDETAAGAEELTDRFTGRLSGGSRWPARRTSRVQAPPLHLAHRTS